MPHSLAEPLRRPQKWQSPVHSLKGKMPSSFVVLSPDAKAEMVPPSIYDVRCSIDVDRCSSTGIRCFKFREFRKRGENFTAEAVLIRRSRAWKWPRIRKFPAESLKNREF